ncbi:hypothetical protein G6F68_013577 [Rhizopus microsporus]|nr:hypothetical protein G6F68_013577 [Rhizopus microsporus]
MAIGTPASRHGLIELQAGQQARIRHVLGVGAEHARHVGPDLHAAGAEQRAEVRRRGIRATATENGGTAVGMPRDEALGDQQAGRLRAEALHPVCVRAPLAVHRQPLRPVALVRLRRHRVQPLAGIHPAHVQAGGVQVGRAQRGGQQLALAQHVGLPVQRAGPARPGNPRGARPAPPRDRGCPAHRRRSRSVRW